MGAVETGVWFPRICGRVLCVHGSGSFHSLPSRGGVTKHRLPRRECLGGPALERRGRICAPAR